MSARPETFVASAEPGAAAAVLAARGVHRVYSASDAAGGYTYALRDIDLEVREGEFVCLVGQSGCGKSTLLNLLAGLDQPSGGSVVFRGQPISGPQSRDTGYVFQHSVLLPWLRIIDNVLLPSKLMGLDHRRLRTRAHELLDLVGLADFVHHFPHQLSGGMQQRASIARSLVHSPSVLLMDEPFGALDALTRDRLNGELLRIWELTGTTIVFVTHDLREAAYLSDRIVVMSARPGAVRAIVDSPLARPRHTGTVHEDAFRDLVHHLGDLIG